MLIKHILYKIGADETGPPVTRIRASRIDPTYAFACPISAPALPNASIWATISA